MNDESKKETRKLSKGIISEKRLVELFATEKQICNYKTKGKFVSSNKETVLKQARREVEIEDLGDKKYKISKILKYPVPKCFDEMNSGLHKYLTPLILSNLIMAGIYKSKTLTFSTKRWFEDIQLINENYSKSKNNIDFASKHTDIEPHILKEFFSNTDDSLVYYFKKTLEYLRKSDLFDYQKINWICIMDIDNDEKDDISQKKIIKMKKVHRRATAEEMVTIRRCEQAACNLFGISINDVKAKYYGIKSHDFLTEYKRQLLMHNILFVYKAYEIYATDLDVKRCEELIKAFNMPTDKELSDMLVFAFKKNIAVNAGNRIEKKPRKYGIFEEDEAEQFINDYEKIASLTLGSTDNEAFLNDVPQSLDETEEEYINHIIKENLDISLDGRKLKVGIGKTKTRAKAV